MSSIPTIIQLPIGLGLGVISVIAPGLLRPFVIVALAFAGLQAVLLYQAGGATALAVPLGWLVDLTKEVTLVLIGLGVGRIGTGIVFGVR